MIISKVGTTILDLRKTILTVMTPFQKNLNPKLELKQNASVLPAVSSEWDCKGLIIFRAALSWIAAIIKSKVHESKNTHPKAYKNTEDFC